MTNTGTWVLSTPCKAQSNGEAELLTDAPYKAVAKPDQCQKEAVTREELILASPGSLYDPLGPIAS